tara:strand:+ start:1071 stop:1790 length:720 start_codon:yes stop_codon:yes gene_type:complete
MAQDIRMGRWKFNHQGIAFYNNGVLADGQHRLAAVVRANKTIKILVTRGLDVSSGIGIDNHRPRTAGDIIKVSALSDWVRAAEVKLVRSIYQSTNAANATLTPTEIVELADSQKEHIQFGASVMKSAKRIVTSTPVKAALVVAHRYEDERKLRTFAEIMYSGMATDPSHSVIITLRENLINDPMAGVISGSHYTRQVTMKTMRGIKAFCSGEKLTRIQAQTDMAYTFESFKRISHGSAR